MDRGRTEYLTESPLTFPLYCAAWLRGGNPCPWSDVIWPGPGATNRLLAASQYKFVCVEHVAGQPAEPWLLLDSLPFLKRSLVHT